MSDCKCTTVKFYSEHQEWRCMLCYKQFAPSEDYVGLINGLHGAWVFVPEEDMGIVEKHGTG